jgi:hypothetical protein
VADVRDPAAPPFLWRNGFIHRAELASERGRALADDLAQLLAHPSGRFLVELALRASSHDDAVDALATLERAAPPTLRELDLFARAALDDLGSLWRHLPGLRRLTVAARAFELGALELPALQRARFLAGRMRAGAVRSIAHAAWPALERLELRFCSHFGSTDADFEDLRPLLFRTDLPALTHLKLRGAPFAGAIIRALTRAPLAQQLHVLDLSAGNISPADIAILAEHAGSFPSLRELWMPYDRLTARHQASLRDVAKHVISDARAPVDTLDYELSGEPLPRGEERFGGIRE